MKYYGKPLHHAKHVPYVARAPRLFFWRVNNHVAYTVIVLTVYFLTARILLGTIDLMSLSDEASENHVTQNAHSTLNAQ